MTEQQPPKSTKWKSHTMNFAEDAATPGTVPNTVVKGAATLILARERWKMLALTSACKMLLDGTKKK